VIWVKAEPRLGVFPIDTFDGWNHSWLRPIEGRDPAMSDQRGRPAEGIPTLDEQLEVWVAHGLIGREEADSIAVFESGHGVVPRGRRVNLATEALAYLGAALAIAAGGTVLGGEWDGLSTAWRVAVPGAIWLALLAMGWRVRRATSSPAIRLARVLWFLSAASLVWTVHVVVKDGFGTEGQWDVLWSGAAVVLFGGALYLARPATLQQLALVAGLFLLAVGLTDGFNATTGVVICAMGVAWILLGWRHLLVDPGAASTIGSLSVLFGALLVAAWEEEAGAWLGVVSSGALIGASIGIRHTAMLVLGAIGLFFSTFGTIEQYVEGTTGIAIGLLVAGLIVLAVAAIAARFDASRWRTEGVSR
jgi:hypothetical protein